MEKSPLSCSGAESQDTWMAPAHKEVDVTDLDSSVDKVEGDPGSAHLYHDALPRVVSRIRRTAAFSLRLHSFLSNYIE